MEAFFESDYANWIASSYHLSPNLRLQRLRGGDEIHQGHMEHEIDVVELRQEIFNVEYSSNWKRRWLVVVIVNKVVAIIFLVRGDLIEKIRVFKERRRGY